MPTIAGGQRRLLFTGNVKTNLVNKYTSGAGVGALSTSSRRALKRRATSSAGTLDSKGNLIPGKPCCSVELERKPEHELYYESNNNTILSSIDVNIMH